MRPPPTRCAGQPPRRRARLGRGCSRGRRGWPVGWDRLGLLLLLLPGSLGAQTAGPARYAALQLDCGRYRSSARAEVTLVVGRERSRETTGHEGVMVLHAVARDSLIGLDAWFDSLDVWREGSGARVEPDTDGLIGGRYRGLLSATGGFTPTDAPFIPDEVAQVADLTGALAELLPPLPPVALRPGHSWSDDLGTVITRLADQTLEGQRTQRYRLVRRFTRRERRSLPDSTEVTATRTETETGTFAWVTEVGPVRWERDIEDDIEVPTGGVVKQPFRSRIRQHVLVLRVSGPCGPGA